MIVTWVAIQSQLFPWADERTNVAYVACGERPGELALIRPQASSPDPGLARLLDSLERAVSQRQCEPTCNPSLEWLRGTIPDQGTSIRLSPLQRCESPSYEFKIQELAEQS